MGFDLENFGLGLLAGWASAYGVYRARGAIASAAASVSKGASSAQNSATRSADSRYINDLADLADRAHLAGDSVRLSDLVIEPRFIAPQPFAAPPDDEVAHDIFRVVPLIHDHPHLHAVYNIDTLSIDEISSGSRALALLGLPGSGRTTALMAIALYSLGKVNFKAPVDKIQARLDSEEAALSEKERAVRVKERILIEQRAKERLANEQGAKFDAEADEELKAALPLFRRLMPVYVHLANIVTPMQEYGAEVDPAEPLVRAVQYSVKRVTASTIPRNLYNRLNRGQALVLIDGYDDLPEFDRVRAAAWLEAFLNRYSQNFIIAAGPVEGYGLLSRIGLTPIFLRPWNDLDAQKAVQRWADAWPLMSSKRRRGANRPDEAAINRAQTNIRALLPLEVTAKAWASFAGEVEVAGYEGWIRTAIARLLPPEQSFSALAPQLAQIAALQLEEGYITSERLQALKIGGEDVPDAQEQNSANDENKDSDVETKTAQGRLLGMLRRSGLMVRFRGDRYQFRHYLFAAYLGSLAIRTARLEEQSAMLNHPLWRQAVAYLALHTPVDDLIRRKLSAPPDVLHNHVLGLARWLAYATSDATWRGEILRRLGNLLIAPNQYPLIRARAAAALIETRDQNSLLIFRRAVRNVNPAVRRLACLGLGAIGSDEGVRDLQPLLQDLDPDVQLAAGMALGAIGSEPALESMVIAFTEGSEQLRQAMAEAFAALPEEGYPILYDAISDEDMMLRRAAIFGLRRIRTTWALIAIYRAFLEDDQWYVRSAAQQAFQELQYGRAITPTVSYPKPDSIAWLIEWAASRGETVPSGDAAQQVLLKALQEGEPNVRALAALNLGQLGLANTARALYNALRDRQEEVRAAAHEGLSEIQLKVGRPLPIPA